MVRKPSTERPEGTWKNLPLFAPALRCCVGRGLGWWRGWPDGDIVGPNPSLISQEIFGPVLTVYVYPDEKYRETLQLVDSSTSYGLTGAVFAQDKLVASALAALLVCCPHQFSTDLTSWMQFLLISLPLSLRAFPQSSQPRANVPKWAHSSLAS